MLENPQTSERLVFLETSESTGGELVSFELVFRPRGYTAIKHVQPNQEERHEVLEGHLGVEVDGGRQTLGPGESVTFPPGVSCTGFSPSTRIWCASASRSGPRSARNT